MIKLGENIKSLRKQKNISQEVLANYLGVSFQAVSKWENGNTMPDVTMIPAIASFFGVSTDELFDFNVFEMEKQIDEICDEAYKYRFTDTPKSEAILREGLQRFPGNEIILNKHGVWTKCRPSVSVSSAGASWARPIPTRFAVFPCSIPA